MNAKETVVLLDFPAQTTDTIRIFVAGRKYVIRGVPVVRRNGDVLVSYQDYEHAEYMIASDLITHVIVTGETLKFLRKTIGLRIEETAERLGSSAERIREWESGKGTIDLPEWEALAAMVKKGPVRLDQELTSAEAMAEVHEEEE